MHAERGFGAPPRTLPHRPVGRAELLCAAGHRTGPTAGWQVAQTRKRMGLLTTEHGRAGYLADFIGVVRHATHHWRSSIAWTLQRKRRHALHHSPVGPLTRCGVTGGSWGQVFGSSGADEASPVRAPRTNPVQAWENEGGALTGGAACQRRDASGFRRR